MISIKASRANSLICNLRLAARRQPRTRILTHSRGTAPPPAFPAGYFSTSHSEYEDHRFAATPMSHTVQKSIHNEKINAALDENKFPIGSLTLEQFLEFEEDLRSLCSKEYQVAISKASIQQSFLLLRRLIQEHEANPDVLDHFEMTHWMHGNYPRCTKLLDECLFNWGKWWELHPHDEQLHPEAVEAFIDSLQSGKLPILVTEQTYRLLMDAAIQGGASDQAAIFVDRLLNQMVEESLENPRLRPTVPTLQSALRAWSKSGLPQAPQRAEAIFQAMGELYDDGLSQEAPDNAAYLALMKAWRFSPPKIEEILHSQKVCPYPHVAPSTAAYRLAIHGWINCQSPKSTAKAYSLFLELIRAYMNTRDETILIDSDFFSAMISTLAKERECEKAEEIFHLLEELYKGTDDKRFEPSTKTLLGMIIAYSKNGKPHAARKAESILLELEGRVQTDPHDQDLPPKRGYYSDVIHALVKGSQKEDLDRAEQLLSRMVRRHQDGWVNILPDKALFDQVIDGWSRSNTKDGPLRAERLLQTMQSISKDLRRNDTKPDEKTYFHAITAWARSKDPAAPNRAEKLFFDMLEQYNKGDTKMKPSMFHYTTLINCWARSSHPDGPIRAQQAFETVIAFYESGDKDFEPDSMLYHALMKSFSRTGDATTVESIFLQQFEAYTSSKRKNVMPSTMSFNLLLEAWLNSGHREAHEKATLVYDSMIEFTEEQTLHVPPDAFTFSTMIDIMVRSHSLKQAEKYLEMMKAARAKAERRSNDKWLDQERRAMKRIQSAKRKRAEIEVKESAKK